MPKVTANCPKCQRKLVLPSAVARVRCPHCSEVFAPLARGEEAETRTLDPSVTTDHAPQPADANRATLTLDPDGKATTDGSPDLQKISRFEIRRWLGEGAFGAVYEAYDPQLDRAVAIRVAKLGGGDAEQRIKRFLREAKAAAGLRHPHIVPVHEFGQEGDQFYIVSSFIKGRTLQADLAERKEKKQPADLPRAARIVQQLAEALAYAHGQGIVHRDVKPANVMLDDKDQPMLMDFGLATRQEEAEKLTHAGAVLGTPLYMSPEQARGKGADALPASDQYSLGVLLYEMIAGQPPFEGAPELVMFHHMETEPTSPRKHNRAISRDLETICLKCLEKNAEKRYADCRGFVDDLRRFQDGEPVVARAVGTVERLWRWCRRKPALAAASSLAAFGLVLALVVFAGAFFMVSAALDKESNERKKAETLAEEKRLLAEKEKSLADANKLLADKQTKLADANKLLADEQKTLADTNKLLADEQKTLADANRLLAEKEGKARLEAVEGREQAETLALRVQFEHYLSKVEDRSDLALVGMASLLPKAARLKDQSLTDLLRLQVGTWSGRTARLTATSVASACRNSAVRR